jgi:Peptidase family S41
MASLNHTNAIIFDLWDNRGGYSSTVSLIAAYLFDHPEYMYDPRVNPTPHSSTLSPVAGNRLADKPVYVLTSVSTISAAEQFCYGLKMLKRVTYRFHGSRVRIIQTSDLLVSHQEVIALVMRRKLLIRLRSGRGERI